MSILAAVLFLFSTGQDSLVTLLPEGSCAGCTVQRTERYAGAALAGYINGGAELYKEYGFISLTMEEIRLPGGEDLVVEAYRMRTAAAAYGIFSISRFGCAAPDTAFTHFCGGATQIQCAAGEWYVRVTNGSGSRVAQESSRMVLRALVSRTGQPRFPLPLLFAEPAVAGSANELMLMTGPLGVQNGLPDWEDLLDGAAEYTLHAMRLQNNQGILAELRFSRAQDAMGVARKLGVDVATETLQRATGSPKRYIRWTSPLTLRILETTLLSPDLDPYLEVLSPPGH